MKRLFTLLLVSFSFVAFDSISQTKTCKLTIAETISAKGNDDAYITKSCDVEQFNLSIYNRKGDVIYKSEDAESFWDFNEKKGEKLIFDQGVYKYMVTYKFVGEPRAKSKAGSITLIR